MSAFRSEASFDRYRRSFNEAAARFGLNPRFFFDVGPFGSHPLYIDAWAERIHEVLKISPASAVESTLLLFCAHAIPQTMAKASRYTETLEAASAAVAERAGVHNWSVCYQSRSGRPQDPWTGPSVADAVLEAQTRGFKRLVAVPIGFLIENAEILYELDHEAKRLAQSLGMSFSRARTVGDHPRFVEMAACVVLQAFP